MLMSARPLILQVLAAGCGVAACGVLAATGCQESPVVAKRTSTLPTTRAVDSSTRLKLVTYNVKSCGGGLNRIVGLLRNQKADIIFLQEVARLDGGRSDQAVRIAYSLGGMHVVSATTLGVPIEQHCDVAIVSRYELHDGAAYSLESGGWVYALGANIHTLSRPSRLFSVHTHATFRLNMTHIRESSQTRMAQVEGLLDVVSGWHGDIIVGGDFNATPWMREYSKITRKLKDFGLADGPAKKTFPSDQPALRIDYLFGRGMFDVQSYQVLDAEWSDHRPVAAVLNHMKKESRTAR